MEAKKKAIIVSGYFNPIHKGHLELFELAKQNADKLWVIVNSDKQRELKGSEYFLMTLHVLLVDELDHLHQQKLNHE